MVVSVSQHSVIKLGRLLLFVHYVADCTLPTTEVAQYIKDYKNKISTNIIGKQTYNATDDQSLILNKYNFPPLLLLLSIIMKLPVSDNQRCPEGGVHGASCAIKILGVEHVVTAFFIIKGGK